MKPANRASMLRHRGAALIVVLACAAVLSTVMAGLIRLALADRGRLEAEAWRVQARWLAESALDRAAARLAADPDYRGETWPLSAEALAARDGATIEIQVEPVPGRRGRRMVRVRADYPDHPHLRVRRAAQVFVDLTSTGETP